MRTPGWLASILALVLAGCGSGPDASLPPPVHVDVAARRPAMLLSDYRLFTDPHGRVPNQGVVPYALNTPQYADDAQISHFVYLPPDAQAAYHPTNAFSFPPGTVLIQHLAISDEARERLVETRLLLHLARGWVAVPYRWNDDQTEARRVVVGGKTTVPRVAPDGSHLPLEWVTPDMNQCKRCHAGLEETRPIGTTARNLNRPDPVSNANQLVRWQELGMLEGAPADVASIPRAPVWDDPESGSVDERARTWLDVNCAYCHNPDGPAGVSGLDLSFDQQLPVKYGVYKPPVAAGRGSGGSRFSIEPGHPDRSFLLARIRSTDPGVMMPTVGRSRVDVAGTALIEQWIRDLPPDPALAARALDPVAAFQEAASGGDPVRGRELFHSGAQCAVCHVADGPEGGTVGPSLADIASRATRADILESVVAPNAALAEGYATTVLTLADGRSLSGRIHSEDAQQIVLGLADGTTTAIPAHTITQRDTSTMSIMPSLAAALPVDDVRDLVAYLSTCRTGSN